MSTKTATVTVTIDEPSSTNPTSHSTTFTYESENSFDESCDIEYKNEEDGGPIMRPKNPPSGL